MKWVIILVLWPVIGFVLAYVWCSFVQAGQCERDKSQRDLDATEKRKAAA